MKRNPLIVLIMSATLIVTSCKKEEKAATPETPTKTTPTTSTTFQESFSAKIDGKAFTGEITSTNLGGNITVFASNKTETVSLTFPNNVTTGTQPLNHPSSYTAYSAHINFPAKNLYSSNGNITITSHDTALKQIVGTFSFTASLDYKGVVTTRSQEITDGKFTVKY